MLNPRELVDVMTFYKPIHILAEEGKPLMVSLLSLLLVFVFYGVVFVGLSALMSGAFSSEMLQSPEMKTLEKAFAFLILQVPIATTAAFILSRIFTRKGSLAGIISVNYFLCACAALFALVTIIPYAQFAGLLLFLLSGILYLYFLEESFEKLFEISSLKSVGLTIVYAIITLSLWGLSAQFPL